MRDLSLHIMDLAQNSVRANARLVRIEIRELRSEGWLHIIIEDDGCGMSEELLAQVHSPFTTTRTTRHVGLGIPLFEANARLAGGGIELTSTVDRGTRLVGTFGLQHVDRLPLGDIVGTMVSLIVSTPVVPDYAFALATETDEFLLDTREMRETLGDVPLDVPEVVAWMRESMREAFETLMPELYQESQTTMLVRI